MTVRSASSILLVGLRRSDLVDLDPSSRCSGRCKAMAQVFFWFLLSSHGPRNCRASPRRATYFSCSCKKSRQKNTSHAPDSVCLLRRLRPSLWRYRLRACIDAASCSRLSPGQAYSAMLRWLSLPAHPAVNAESPAGANGAPGSSWSRDSGVNANHIRLVCKILLVKLRRR